MSAGARSPRRGLGDGGVAAHSDAGGAEGGAARVRMRVLVVEDDQVDRMAVRRHLSRIPADVAVEEAEGVLEAIGRLTAEPFDCVLLDYNLPDGDGLTFLRGLRAAGLQVPVVMLTGQEDVEVARDLMMAGAAGYIPKGQLSAALLLSSITAAMQGREAGLETPLEG